MTTMDNVVSFPVRTKLLCSKCGAKGEIGCECGVEYIKANAFAARVVADPANASKGTRQLAAETGLGHGTIQRAKAGVPNGTPDQRVVGKDGRSHPAKRAKKSKSKSESKRSRVSSPKPMKAFDSKKGRVAGIDIKVKPDVWQDFNDKARQEKQSATERVAALIVADVDGVLNQTDAPLFDWSHDAVADIARKLAKDNRNKAGRLHEALGDVLAIASAPAKDKETMVSLHLIIKQFVPLLEKFKDLTNTHPAHLDMVPNFLATLVSEGQRIIDGWANGDESVRRVRGHVVLPKTPANTEKDDTHE